MILLLFPCSVHVFLLVVFIRLGVYVVVRVYLFSVSCLSYVVVYFALNRSRALPTAFYLLISLRKISDLQQQQRGWVQNHVASC